MTPEHRQYVLDHLHKQSVPDMAQSLGIKEREIRKFLEQEHEKHKEAGPSTALADKYSSKIDLFLILSSLFIAALAVGIYLNIIHGKFLLDDNLLIVDNIYIKSWSYLKMFFTRGIGEVVGATSTYYRPLQVLAYTVLYHFWKLNPAPYHILNIVFHALLGLSVFWMINTLFKDRLLALFATMLYVVHPAHVESVAYISGLGDCMVGFATVLTFVLYVKQYESRGSSAFGFYSLMAVSYIISLFVKENAIIFPGLVLLYHVTFRKKIKLVPFLSVILITAVYLVFRASLSKTGAAGMTATSVLQRVPGFFVALSIYMRILPLPFDLYMGHENAIFVFNHPQVIVGAIAFITLAAAALLSWKKHNIAFFSIGWFFISIAPVSNLYPIAFYMADHYLYLPSIGFFLLVGWAFRILYNKEIFKFGAIAGVAALTIYFSYLTVIQNYYWKDPVFFYRRTLAYAPYSARMYANLAKEYGLDKNVEKAIELYKTAVKVDPTHTVAWYNLGVSYFKLGRYEEAVEYCKKAIATDPKYAHSYNIIGASYLTMGKPDEAIESFKKALSIYPNHVDTMLNLSTAYYKKGEKDESANMLKMIIEKNPQYPTAYSNLGFIYAEKGDHEKAIEFYRKAIELDPKYIDAHNNMAFSLFKLGEKDKAMALYKKVLLIDPANKQAKDNLSILEQEMNSKK